MVGQQRVGGSLRFLAGGDAEQAGRLSITIMLGVLMADAQSASQPGFRRGEALGPDRHHVARTQGVVELRDDAPVDLDRSPLEPGANLFAFRLGPRGEKIVEQPGRLFLSHHAHQRILFVGSELFPRSTRLRTVPASFAMELAGRMPRQETPG